MDYTEKISLFIILILEAIIMSLLESKKNFLRKKTVFFLSVYLLLLFLFVYLLTLIGMRFCF